MTGGARSAPGRSSTRCRRSGARTAGQLQANLRAAELHLTAGETAVLDAASDPQATDYPYGEMGAEQRSRRLASSH